MVARATMRLTRAYDDGDGEYRTMMARYADAYDDGDFVDHVNTSFETKAVIDQRCMYVRVVVVVV